MGLYKICFYHNSEKNKIFYGNFILDHTTAKAWIIQLNKEYPNLHHWFEAQ